MGIGKSSALSVRFALVAACVLVGARANAQHYTQTNLVSDLPGTAAFQDGNLVNPWGLSRSSGSPWWTANNGMGNATLFNGSGEAQPPPPTGPLVVTIPSANGTDTGVPTGTVFNGTPAFKLNNGNPARFLFVTEDGTLSGWNGGTVAEVKATVKDAVYKGMAIASHDGAWFIYATNFAKGRIDVFDASFKPVSMSGGGHHGMMQNDRDEHGEDHQAFVDPRLPHDFSPFGIQDIGGELYVTFAKVKPGTHDDQAGPGFGFVDVFSPSGRLLRRLEHGDWLSSPWGLVLAPSDFGAFSHDLLVGQFGSGEIAAYDVTTGRFLGKMRDTMDHVLVIDGLWSIAFGNGAAAGPLNTLFFTAGLNDEADGLFGSLTPVPAEQLLGNGM